MSESIQVHGNVNQMLRITRAVLFGAALSACVNERPSSFVSVCDSAGVIIVESMAPRWSAAEGWTVDPQPLLDLATSGTGSPHEFFNVQDATRLSDGTIVVADRGSGKIRYFSAEGTFLQAVGRTGEGPGEFRRLTSVDLFRGDSVIAFDSWLGRVTVLSPQREVSRVISPYATDVRLWELRSLHDSAFVVMQYPRGPGGVTEGLYRMSQAIVKLSVTGAFIDTLTAIPGFEGFQFASGDARPLFAKAGHFAVFAGRVYAGSADLMQFQIYSATGDLEHIVRVPGYDLELSAEDLRVERAALLPDGAPPQFRDVVSSMPDPPTRPAYSDLLVDTEGYVWAAEYHGVAERGSATDWEVFTPDGEWLGSVRLPARFTAFEIGGDYVLGKHLDDLDVEHVQMLSLNGRTDE